MGEDVEAPRRTDGRAVEAQVEAPRPDVVAPWIRPDVDLHGVRPAAELDRR